MVKPPNTTVNTTNAAGATVAVPTTTSLGVTDQFWEGEIYFVGETTLDKTNAAAQTPDGRDQVPPEEIAAILTVKSIWDYCTEELDPYSRYLGRNPDKAQALEGLLQLPVELWPVPVRAEIEDLKRYIAG